LARIVFIFSGTINTTGPINSGGAQWRISAVGRARCPGDLRGSRLGIADEADDPKVGNPASYVRASFGNQAGPPPTSSFYFKGKKVKVADIARSLGVAYVLDGSVRKSDSTLRVAARLIRADDGYVIWSDTYDRPLDNKLNVQDDIASEVAKALRASIH
jgi:hypothetical protein